jgi:NhaP-type Na+/H+ or K+/H+ antiporter
MFGGLPILFHHLDNVDFGEQQEKRQLSGGEKSGIWEKQSFERIHMNNIKEKFTFYLSGVLYFLFNLRLASTVEESVKATLWQILQTAPFIIGVTWIIVMFLQYMANGVNMPWERRLRIFFALGIMAGLFYGIYEYAGVNPAD